MDTTQFKELFEQQFEAIYGYVAFRIAPDSDGARDITQETFAAALASLPTLRQNDSAGAWLRGIARHKVVDYFRARQMAPLSIGDAIDEIRSQRKHSLPPEQEAALQVSLVLQSLHLRDAEMLEEKYLEGHSVREIAESRGMTEKAVESALSRAGKHFERQRPRFDRRKVSPMTGNMNDDFAIEKAFRDASKAFTPPAGLKQQMLASLAGPLGGAAPAIQRSSQGRSWFLDRKGVLAACAATIALALGLSLIVEFRRDSSGGRWRNVDANPILSPVRPGGAVVLNFPTVAARVARASAVVRCEMVEVTDSALVCKVTRVLYGRISGQTLRLESWVRNAKQMLNSELGREPTQEEVHEKALEGFKFSRDVILFVDQVSEVEGAVACRDVGVSFDVPPKHHLDDEEKQILDVVRSGAYLAPAPTPEALSPYVESSQRILKVTLKTIGETSAEWQVTSVLYAAATEDKSGSIPAISQGSTIKVALDPWRLRAESVARNGAAHKDANAPTDDEVQREFDHLMKTELKLGGEAVLFLRVGKGEKEDVVWKLVGIVRENPANPGRVAEYEKAIRDMISKGQMNGVYW